MRAISAIMVTAVLAVPALGVMQLIGMNEMPAQLQFTVPRAAPAVTDWVAAYRLMEPGQDPQFYLLGRTAQGRRVAVSVGANGQVIEVRTEIPFSYLPVAVLAAMQFQVPDYTPRAVQAIGPDQNTTIYYRFEGRLSNGAHGAILVSADGSQMAPE